MRLRFSLFTKILLWFFLNLLILSVALLAVFNLQFQLDPGSLLARAGNNRIENVARLVTEEIRDKSLAEREAVLQRYATAYRLDFLLYTALGEKIAGKDLSLPAEVLQRIRERPPRPPGRDEPPPGAGPPGGRPPARLPAFPVFTLKTYNPKLYWAGVRIPLHEAQTPEPRPAALLIVSDTMSGNGLFFDPTPWIIILALVLSLSFLLWLPFVRHLTTVIRQITEAAEQIAEERFEVRVDEQRSDELGRLGKAINHLAGRLAGFVHGQKRFLGDISHELNSPLGRMQVALGILEERVPPAQRVYVADVQEEVQLMSKLVSELLTYSKAGIKTAPVQLERVNLRSLAEQVITREVAAGTDLRLDIDEELAVRAHPELLARALANVIRNAVRYAGSGPITLSAERNDGQVVLTVADCGPGVPAAALDKLFDPFFRLEPDRARNTGGTGLGLAITRSCVEACQGSVECYNRQPAGLAIVLKLGLA